ncbi:Rieske 2Fe-2S domain-containing protein [Komagataeibacter diospyri]|uniref:Ring-hydroxylating dioxygenase ferredoxin subunit n=1 Tax=Komagataeibacter diospyri TaxID=1932662 RepID=A0A4P5NVC5_9PROT|nr:Rieske 2Fe-2S domain-containing protein [Komagataeibacter diospyri]GCE83545.1 ring-hydroxylating dioxygenase ferredoxin subunit [Komagataeibacter diospyri]
MSMTDTLLQPFDPDQHAQWYPALRSADLKHQKAIGVYCGSRPVVIVRPEAGLVFALDDRCTHRQVPLSRGVVSGTFIRCPLHGIKFARSGRCYSPDMVLEEMPPRAEGWGCREKEGWIFLYSGNAEDADEALIPSMTHHDGKNWCHETFVCEINAPVLLLMDHVQRFGRGTTTGLVTYLDQSISEQQISSHYRVVASAPLSALPGMTRNWRATVDTTPVDQNIYLSSEDDAKLLAEIWLGYMPTGRDGRTRVCGKIAIRQDHTRLPGRVSGSLWATLLWKLLWKERSLAEVEWSAIQQSGRPGHSDFFPPAQTMQDLQTKNNQRTDKEG